MARTVTSTVRVLDALAPVLRDDPRVDVVFARDNTSAFSSGIPELLAAEEARSLPFSQLHEIDCDLIVTATENADLVGNSTAPVLVLPHGVGFHKHVPDSRSSAERISGVVPEALLLSGRARLAVSHPDQERQLAALHSATRGRTVRIGDPALDRLLAGVRLRGHYRRALGVREDQRLVVFTSTWRGESLLGSHPELPARAASELPYDAYRCALVVHPNVTAWHGGWRLRSLLSSAREAGLLLVDPAPSDGWQSALLAADLVVGDHGSVTFYAAALGVPTLLAAFGSEAVPDTPLAELGACAARLDHSAPLLPQVTSALRADTEQLSKVAANALAWPGDSARRLRRTVYDLLRLDEPDAPARVLAPAPPAEPLPEVRAHVVRTAWTGRDGMRLEVTRNAAAPEPPVVEAAVTHLACREDERDDGLRQRASALLASEGYEDCAAAARWARHTLDTSPGAVLAAAAVDSGTWLVGVRGSGAAVVRAVRARVPDVGVPAAVVYALVRGRRSLEGAEVRVSYGEGQLSPSGDELCVRVESWSEWSRSPE